MTYTKTPADLMKTITEAIQTRNPSIVKNFLEEFTMEIIESQKPIYEKMLVGAAEQGIIAERERCINMVAEALPNSEERNRLISKMRGEPDEESVQES